MGLTAKRDGDLLRLYVEQGAEEAFSELGHRYARLIYSTCLRETGDRVLAEDAAQGVLLLLSQRAGALQYHDTIAGWLYAASRNIARNLVKLERRKKMTEARAMTATVLEPEANSLWERIDPHFHAALDRLKPADREAVLLRFMEEWSLAEVGAALGITENTARMRINRALERIRKYLDRVGIVLTVGALALLLEQRSGQAAPAALLAAFTHIAQGTNGQPVPTAPIAQAIQRTARRMTMRSLLRPLIIVISGLLLIGGTALYRQTLPQRLSRIERQQLYAALTGTWQGTIEFADDRSGQHFTYPATVIADVQEGGDAFRFTTNYAGVPYIDPTTLRENPRTGELDIYNGGPHSSHTLSGSGDLFRLPNGTYAFIGFSMAQNRDVRLLFLFNQSAFNQSAFNQSAFNQNAFNQNAFNQNAFNQNAFNQNALKSNSFKPYQLTIQEEYRHLSRSDYQFRNRLILQRH